MIIFVNFFYNLIDKIFDTGLVLQCCYHVNLNTKWHDQLKGDRNGES